MLLTEINKAFDVLSNKDVEEIMALEPGYIYYAYSGGYFYSTKEDEHNIDCYVGKLVLVEV